ncbi:MAG: hypothetical protein KTR22_12570 [Flavobacteriaceae bacterium]|nr:hypothetical protein [Flavobacteriaceae bacterium]
MLAGNILLLVFSLFLLDFIIRKNGLTQMNAYSILLYANLVCFFPAIFREWTLIGASVCLLFALRRIVSLQSLKNTERKILDATLWITIATFFYPPSLFMLLALQWAIFIMPLKKTRYFFIPLVGIVVVFLIASAYLLLTSDSIDWLSNLLSVPSRKFEAYGTPPSLIAIPFIIGTLIWAIFSRLGNLSRIPKKERPNYQLVVVVCLVSFFMIILSYKKNTTEFIVAFAPWAIIFANYIEQDSDKWFKELLLWLFLILPFLRFFI